MRLPTEQRAVPHAFIPFASETPFIHIHPCRLPLTQHTRIHTFSLVQKGSLVVWPKRARMRVHVNAGKFLVHVRASVPVNYPQTPVVIEITKSNFPGKFPRPVCVSVSNECCCALILLVHTGTEAAWYLCKKSFYMHSGRVCIVTSLRVPFCWQRNCTRPP